MSLKSGFLKNKAHILYLLLIIIKTLKFLKNALIFTVITSFRHNKNKAKEKILIKQRLFEDQIQRSSISN